MATFSVHFDGDITVDHRVSVRVLANTYTHMQRAIDRAFLVEKYGSVEKNERLTKEEYQETEFIALYPAEGGIILDAVKLGAERIIDRVYSATNLIYEKSVQGAFQQHQNISQQLAVRRNYVNAVGSRTQSFDEVMRNPDPDWEAAYSNRSIVKEIDRLAIQVTRSDLSTSYVDISLNGSRANLPLHFTPAIAKRFHQIAADRELGAPMLATVQIRMLDVGGNNKKPSAKVLNLDTGRIVNLDLSSEEDFEALHAYHTPNTDVRLYVCPVIEAGGYDINGGDLKFLAVA